MAREDLHFRLRIPEHLKRHIETQAEGNGRSMTAEIVFRLEWSFHYPPELIEEMQTDRSQQAREISLLQTERDVAVTRAAELSQQVDELRLKAALAEERAKAFYEVFAYTSAVLAAATGHDKKAMEVLATAIRSMAHGGEKDQIRAELIDQIAKRLTSTPEGGES